MSDANMVPVKFIGLDEVWRVIHVLLHVFAVIVGLYLYLANQTIALIIDAP